MSNYTKTTDFAAKDSLPTGDAGKIIRGAEFGTEFDNIATAIATKADTAGPTLTGTTTFDTLSDGTIGVTAFVDEDDMSSDSATMLPTQQSVKAYVDSQTTAQDLDFEADTGGPLSIDLDSETLTLTGGTGVDTSGAGNAVTFAIDSTVATLTGTQTLTNKTLTSADIDTPDIDGGTIDGTVIGGTTAAAVSATTVSATGNITVDGTVDGRDVAADGTKLDTVETNADVTDTTNVTAAGALMDSEVTNLAQVKAFDSADYATAAQGTTADAALPKTGGAMTGAITTNSTFDGRDVATDGTKLDGIEALADVTDTTNVTAAGALMDSELTDLTAVKSLDQGVATTDSPTFAGLTTTADVSFGDNDKAIFGAGSDLQIYHDGSNSYVKDAGTGQLILQGSTKVILKGVNGDNFLQGNEDGAVNLYHNDSQKLATSSTGIDVTGVITTDGMTTSADINFGDNNKAVFGAGNDLQIYHTGTQNYIEDAGTGNLNFKSNGNFYNFLDGSNATVFQIDLDDATRLYHNTTQKLATTSTGIDVTGTIVGDGLEVDTSNAGNGLNYSFDLKNSASGSATSYAMPAISWANGGLRWASVHGERNPAGGYGGSFVVNTMNSSGSAVKRLDIDSGGDISFYEDTGTTAKFYWDASAESLGIGTSSPSSALHVDSSNDGPIFDSGGTGNTNHALLVRDSANSQLLRVNNNGNVGIGTSSPSRKLDVRSGAFNSAIAQFTGANDGRGLLISTFSRASNDDSVDYDTPFGGHHTFSASGAEKVRITNTGNVGIGSSSPSTTLEVTGTGDAETGITATHSRSGVGYTLLLNNTNNGANKGSGIKWQSGSFDTGAIITRSDATAASGDAPAYMTFHTSSDGSEDLAERMRIDASGRAIVGKTVADNGTVGITLFPEGVGSFVADGSRAATFVRKTDDGDLIQFRKDTTTVGSIGAKGGTAYLIGSSKGLRVSGSGVIPITTGGVNSDATYDIGDQAVRFKDLYLSSGVNVSGDSASLLTQLSLANASTDLASGSSIDFQTGSGSTTTSRITSAYSLANKTELIFSTYNSGLTESMRISDGNLLVGTTSSLAPFTLNKSNADWLAHITNTNANPRGLGIFHSTDSNSTSNWFLYCEGGGSTKRFAVRSNGGIANYQANDVNLSDERVKTDITPLGSMWEKFKAIEIVSFKYKDQTHNDSNIGVIAQQVEKVASEFVDVSGFDEAPENEEPLKAIYTADLYHATIKALQEAMNRIEILEAEVTALKGD